MYLSEVRIVNWRSYRDVRFALPEPSTKKPVALVGAMNGHGKTSLLYALYFGLFGRYATSFAADIEGRCITCISVDFQACDARRRELPAARALKTGRELVACETRREDLRDGAARGSRNGGLLPGLLLGGDRSDDRPVSGVLVALRARGGLRRRGLRRPALPRTVH